MKKLLFALVLVASAIFVGCKGSDSGDPKSVLTQFFAALAAGDVEKAKSLATPDSQTMLGLMEMGMKNDKNELKKFDQTKMTFGAPVIDGDKATVPVTMEGETLNYPLKKIDGKWKVAFDKSSMMNMGMEKMREKGPGAADSLNKAMDELKSMNMDSLKDEMNKALDTASTELKKVQ